MKKKLIIVKQKCYGKSLPLKIKLIIIGIAITCFFFLIIFVVLFSVFVDAGLIEIAEGTTGSGSGNYSYISSSTSYWWPIGSNETTSVGEPYLLEEIQLILLLLLILVVEFILLLEKKWIILVRILLLTVGLI